MVGNTYVLLPSLSTTVNLTMRLGICSPTKLVTGSLILIWHKHTGCELYPSSDRRAVEPQILLMSIAMPLP